MDVPLERKFKVVLLGDGGVGKTSLVKRFVYSNYDERYLKTLGTNVYKKEFLRSNFGSNVHINLQVWDVMGQKIFPQVINTSLKGANGVIFVCDLTNDKTLINLEYWIQTVFDNTEDVVFLFVANKSDKDNIMFGYSAIKAVADVFGSPYFITSAMTGDNVEDAFFNLGDRMANGEFLPDMKDAKIFDNKKKVSKILLAEDNIINLFCNAMGGYETAMPLVQDQFKILGIDFEDPTKDDIRSLIKGLLTEVRSSKGPDEAKALKNKFLTFMTNVK